MNSTPTPNPNKQKPVIDKGVGPIGQANAIQTIELIEYV